MAEQDKDRLHIRLHVYDDDIEVKVNRDEEEYYRKAAKLITDDCNALIDVTYKLGQPILSAIKVAVGNFDHPSHFQ